MATLNASPYSQPLRTGSLMKALSSGRLVIFMADRKSLSALRGVGSEFEAGSGDFHAQTLPDRALRVKRPAFRDAGRAPHPEMPVPARG
jgi:hypothetical protein